jgi:hypothetical protein
MTDKYDKDTKAAMANATEDLQKYLATAGRSTTENEILAWQQGYIAGVNRMQGINLG